MQAFSVDVTIDKPREEVYAYLLDIDATGRAHTDKAFYVSPFNDVSGRYALASASPMRGR